MLRKAIALILEEINYQAQTFQTLQETQSQSQHRQRLLPCQNCCLNSAAKTNSTPGTPTTKSNETIYTTHSESLPQNIVG